MRNYSFVYCLRTKAWDLGKWKPKRKKKKTRKVASRKYNGEVSENYYNPLFH